MMNDSLMFLLYRLAVLGACWKPIYTSTVKLSKLLNISQQTISRWIRKLEAEGLIVRAVSGRGQFIKLSDKGLKCLREFYVNLKKIFSEIPSSYNVRGIVFSGFGEGAYYVSLPYYFNQFTHKLGFTPFLGTLNLKLKSIHDLEVKKLLEFLPGIEIKGFSNGFRTYGGAKCFKAKVDDIPCAVVLIERTHYGDDVLELISNVKLRDALNLKDGDEVTVTIFLSSP
ncbi:MAG: DUF120 domain-containing protein [Candidatus Verstraetearchaeota archaeon]|nr:DUF120 domain-containing protein [Candidatus Verstraetearchaeota archaeon]